MRNHRRFRVVSRTRCTCDVRCLFRMCCMCCVCCILVNVWYVLYVFCTSTVAYAQPRSPAELPSSTLLVEVLRLRYIEHYDRQQQQRSKRSDQVGDQEGVPRTSSRQERMLGCGRRVGTYASEGGYNDRVCTFHLAHHTSLTQLLA